MIVHLHKANPVHTGSVTVHEVFQGQTVWKGHVEVFELTGHPQAKRCYAWSHPETADGQGERFVAVLEMPPVTSPATAVKASIVSDVRKKKLDKKPRT